MSPASRRARYGWSRYNHLSHTDRVSSLYPGVTSRVTHVWRTPRAELRCWPSRRRRRAARAALPWPAARAHRSPYSLTSNDRYVLSSLSSSFSRSCLCQPLTATEVYIGNAPVPGWRAEAARARAPRYSFCAFLKRISCRVRSSSSSLSRLSASSGSLVAVANELVTVKPMSSGSGSICW